MNFAARRKILLALSLQAVFLGSFLIYAPRQAAAAVSGQAGAAAETNFPAALRDRIAREYFKSIQYYLTRYGAGEETGRWLAKNEKRVLAAALAAAQPANARLDELLAAVRGAILSTLQLKDEEKERVERAVKETADYLYVSGAEIFAEIKLPEYAAPAAGGNILSGFSPEIENLPKAALPMADLKGYVRGQLGPMAELFAWLGPELRTVLFTRRPLTEALGLLGRAPARIYRLNIPGSTYAFEAYLTYGSGTGLIFCNFSGDSWFTHVQSVYRLFFSQQGAAPAVTVDPAPGKTIPCPGVMEAFSGSLPREFSGLLLGYSQELKKAFGLSVKKEHSGPGWRAFEAEIEGKTYISIETRDSWYGEILGATVRALLEAGVKFDSVYFAGSAGSLKYNTPYTMARPGCFYDRDGGRLAVGNALAGSDAGLCHRTVPSPLSESREYLAGLPGDAGTIDVEGLHLVKAVLDHNAAAGRKISLGLSYLVTDYPRGLAATENFALSSQRLEGKLAGTRQYAAFLLEHLKSGRLAYEHPIENSLGESAASLSKKNMEKKRLEFGPLSAAEQAAFDKIAGAAPPVVMRLGRHRLGRMLEAGLALAPDEVGIMTGRPVSTQTFTPQAENELYGAWDYLFAGAGQNTREELYGAVQLFLSSAAWARRSYATPFSGFRIMEETAGKEDALGLARRRWGKFMVAPEDYARSLAFSFISHARKSGAAGELGRAARAATAGEVYAVLGGCDTCYLETKMLKYFTLDEIDCVELPPGMAAAVPELEKLRGRVFETPGACLARLGAAPGARAAAPKYSPAAGPAVPLSRDNAFFRDPANPAGDYWALASFYAPQRTGASCSAASVSMALNALLNARRQRGDEEENITEGAVVEKVHGLKWRELVSEAGADGRHGLSLAQLAAASKEALAAYGAAGASALSVTVDTPTPQGLENFRKALSENESDPGDIMLLHFMQDTLNGAPGGPYAHISPVGAYDAKTRRVLVFDVDRQWYEPYWAADAQVYKAMSAETAAFGRGGWVVLKTGK